MPFRADLPEAGSPRRMPVETSYHVAWERTQLPGLRKDPRPRRRRSGLCLPGARVPSVQPVAQGVLGVLPAPGEKLWIREPAVGILSPDLPGCGNDLPFQQVRPARRVRLPGSPMSEVTQILQAIAQGDPDAAGQLLCGLYGKVAASSPEMGSGIH